MTERFEMTPDLNSADHVIVSRKDILKRYGLTEDYILTEDAIKRLDIDETTLEIDFGQYLKREHHHERIPFMTPDLNDPIIYDLTPSVVNPKPYVKHSEDDTTTDEIIGQLVRYGAISSGPLRAALFALTDVNDDLANARHESCVITGIDRAIMHLERLKSCELDPHKEDWIGST